MSAVGSFVKYQRNRIGLTQHELAQRLGERGFKYADSSIAFWETGRGLPPLNDAQFVRALAEALEVPMTSVLEAAGFFEPGEYITGDDLSPMERRLIAAMRSGKIVEALQAFTALSQDHK